MATYGFKGKLYGISNTNKTLNISADTLLNNNDLIFNAITVINNFSEVNINVTLPTGFEFTTTANGNDLHTFTLSAKSSLSIMQYSDSMISIVGYTGNNTILENTWLLGVDNYSELGITTILGSNQSSGWLLGYNQLGIDTIL